MDIDYEGAAEIERAWREGLTPDPLLTVSEWSDRHRMLSSKASAEPGRWRTSRTPYLKAIMDCLSPTSPVERVVFMKAAQLGATEMGSNWIGYVIHHAPGPMMAVWPTVEMAKRNSKQRIDPLIEESAALAELIAPARSRDSGNTILAKEFRGGVLVMTGANSAVGLRSMPVRYLFLDEVDGYPLDVEGEGEVFASGGSGAALENALVSLADQAGQAIDGDRDVLASMRRRSVAALSTDLPTDKPARRPFHWPLEFPEVFARERGGFDGMVGNPPFLGGQRITSVAGTAFRDWLVVHIAEGRRGSADLVAYFFLRAWSLLGESGSFGLLAVNTIAEGDTRQVGLEAMVPDHAFGACHPAGQRPARPTNSGWVGGLSGNHGRDDGADRGANSESYGRTSRHR